MHVARKKGRKKGMKMRAFLTTKALLPVLANAAPSLVMAAVHDFPTFPRRRFVVQRRRTTVSDAMKTKVTSCGSFAAPFSAACLGSGLLFR